MAEIAHLVQLLHMEVVVAAVIQQVEAAHQLVVVVVVQDIMAALHLKVPAADLDLVQVDPVHMNKAIFSPAVAVINIIQ
jgi:hypothetical protein